MMLKQGYLLIEEIFFLIIVIALFSTKFFSPLDGGEKKRLRNIDGLRFFLAAFVVFHHINFSYNWLHGLGWVTKGYNINFKAGRLGVALFFYDICLCDEFSKNV